MPRRGRFEFLPLPDGEDPCLQAWWVWDSARHWPLTWGDLSGVGWPAPSWARPGAVAVLVSRQAARHAAARYATWEGGNNG